MEYVVNAGTFTELYTEFNGQRVTLVRWLTEDIARVRTSWGLELDLRDDEISPIAKEHTS